MRIDVYTVIFHVQQNVYFTPLHGRATDPPELERKFRRQSGTRQLGPTLRENIAAHSQDEAIAIVKEQFKSNVPDTFVEIESVGNALSDVLFELPETPVPSPTKVEPEPPTAPQQTEKVQ